MKTTFFEFRIHINIETNFICKLQYYNSILYYHTRAPSVHYRARCGNGNGLGYHVLYDILFDSRLIQAIVAQINNIKNQNLTFQTKKKISVQFTVLIMGFIR